MKRLLTLLLVFSLFISLGLAGCKKAVKEGAEEAVKKTPIKIGAIVSETGPYAGLGVPEKNTLEMEVKKINEAGGINGHKVELIIEDDGTDEAKTVAAATKLIEKDKVVALIGPTGTGQTMAIRQQVEEAEIPNVSMAGGNVITDQLSKWVFVTPPSNRIVVPFTLQYLKDEGWTKIGLITDSGGFGKDGKAVIEEEVKNYGLEIVANETYNPTDVDMKAQLTKIKGTNAQVVLAWTAGKGASIIAKNVKELGMEIPLVVSHGIGMKAFIDGAGDAAEGVIFPIGGRVLVPDTFTEESELKKVTQEYVNDYTSTYNDTQSTFGGHAYDAFHITVNALKALDLEKLDPETNLAELRKALRDAIEKTTDFPGIAGTFTYTPADHMGLSKDDLNMLVIRDGKWELAE
jgi:branched-chain amino acid transport system substrate-binding protein